MTWPVAELDPIARLRVLTEALPGAGMIEHVIDAPYDRVWGYISDLERSIPSFDPMVGSFRIVERYRDRLAAVTTGPYGIPGPRFDVELLDGWCWMQSPVYFVGMAAVPDGDRTRVGHVEGVPFARWRFLRPVFRRIVANDQRNLARLVTRPSS
jgi:hypothetical protein